MHPQGRAGKGCGPKHFALALPPTTPLAVLALPARLSERMRLPGAARLNESIALLQQLTHAEELADFLTLSAYEKID